MIWLLIVGVFLLGALVGSVVAHQLMIRRYHRDPRWVMNWLERWERTIYP